MPTPQPQLSRLHSTDSNSPKPLTTPSHDKSFEFEELFISLDSQYRQGSPRKTSTSLNFPFPDASSLPLNTYADALKALRQYYGVCGNLIIPRSHPLSKVVYDFQWWVSHVQNHPSRVRELNELDFVWGRLQSPWNLVVESLLCYKSLHGHLDVPTSYIINSSYKPCPDYPVACWGLELGVACNNIRSRNFYMSGPTAQERNMQLQGMGFIWDKSEHLFSKTLWAAKEYKMRCGGNSRALRVPQKFVVPSSGRDGWPVELGGFKLGEKLTAVRQKGLYVKNSMKRRAELEEIGFQWSGNSNLGWLEVIHAAAIYSRLHNRVLDVPDNFVVPKAPGTTTGGEPWPWPEHLEGLRLGLRLKKVRLRGDYLKGKNAKGRRRQLDALGFEWREGRGVGRERKKVEGRKVKGRRNAFMFFRRDIAEERRRWDPEAKVGIKEAGEVWRGMGKEGKGKWEEMARLDAERYEREMEEFKRREENV